MAIPYQILVLKSGTNLKQVVSGGYTDAGINDWDPELVEVIETPQVIPWDLRDWIVYWDTDAVDYVQGEEIVLKSQEIIDFVQVNAIVTDPYTGFVGPFDLMQIMHNRKELHNDSESPLYEPSFIPLLGASGSVQNLINIHGKLGWHAQQVKEASYFRPDDMMVYYGWLSGFNAYWNNELVAQDLARYGVIVLGAGIADPSHGDYANTSIIVPRIKALNPCCKILGYVQTSLDASTFENQVDDWATLGVHGIMMDEAGYNYGTVATNGRAAFNAKVDYIHGATMLAMANSWNADHVLGVVDDPSYPNSTWNPTAEASTLNILDWYLLESWPVNTLTGDAQYTNGIEAKGDWAARGEKAKNHRAALGINVAAGGVIEDGHASGQDLANFFFVSALMFSFEAAGVSDHLYGSGSGKGAWWLRPDFKGLGALKWLSPSVQLDQWDSDVYLRFTQFGTLSLDFSAGGETSSVTKR